MEKKGCCVLNVVKAGQEGYWFVSKCEDPSRVLKMESPEKGLKVNDNSEQYLQDKEWQGIVESRLLALEDTIQRQHAFKILLEFLNLSVNRLCHILLPSEAHDEFLDIQHKTNCTIYQIHQLRMSLKNNYSGKTGNTTSSQQIFNDESRGHNNSVYYYLGNINHVLNLIEWLMKSLWSESFIDRHVTEKCGDQSLELPCERIDKSEDWTPILQTLLQLLQKVKRLSDNDPEEGLVENNLSTSLVNGHAAGILDSDCGDKMLDKSHVEELLVDNDPTIRLKDDSLEGIRRQGGDSNEKSVKDSDILDVLHRDHVKCKLNDCLKVVMGGDLYVIPLKGQVVKSANEITDLLHQLLGSQDEVEPKAGYIIESADCDASTEFKEKEVETIEQLMHHVDERLEHYEDVFWEILTNFSHQQDSTWLAFLQRNTDLLLNRRSLHFLLELTSQEDPPLSDVVPVSEILKLCLKCLGSLPLPVFNDIHQWLWNSPRRCQILLDAGAEQYDIELNETFNKLTRCDTSKLAVQVGCLLLQRPKTTLGRAVQDISQNQEAVRTLCEVLQSLPAIKDFCLPGQDTTLIFEILTTALQEKKWKRTEESNLLNFAVRLCQPYQSPSGPEFSFHHPPVVSCELLLKLLVLPSLTIELDSEHMVVKDTDGSTQIPLERSQRLLTKILTCCSQYISVKILSPLLLCLCELLETFSRRNGYNCMSVHKTKDDIIIRSLILENFEVVCGQLEQLGNTSVPCKDQNIQQDLVVLWDQLHLYHWTTKLRVSFNLSSTATQFKQYCSEFMDSIPVMLQSCDSASKEEQLVLWVSILHASSISEKLAERCCEVCSNVALQSADNFPLGHQSLVVSLAHCILSCTEGEWGNIAVLVRGLVSDVLDIPYCSDFTSYLPVSLQGISSALSFSQVMLSVLEVSFQASFDSASHQHIIKCYMVAMQNLLLMYQNDCHDDQSNLFLAGQIFCQACFAMTFVPFECQETLVVLTLEVLGHMEAACRSNVHHWCLVQEDVLRAVDWCSIPCDRDALKKKAQEL